MKDTAKKLATYGRHGDDLLVHMSSKELDNILSLSPDTPVSYNPDTGLPELFDFNQVLDFGVPIVAGAFLGPLGAAAASSAMSYARHKDLGKAAMSGLLSYGLSGVGDKLTAGAGAAAKDGAEIGTKAAQEVARTGTTATTQAAQGLSGQVGQGTNATMTQVGKGLGGPGVASVAPAAAPVGWLESVKQGLSIQADKPMQMFRGAMQPGVASDALFSSYGAAAGLGGMGLAMGANTPKGFDPGEFKSDYKYVAPYDVAATFRAQPSAETDEHDYFTRYAEGGKVQKGLPNIGNEDVQMLRAIVSTYKSKEEAIQDSQRQGSLANQLGLTSPDNPYLMYAFGSDGGPVQGEGDGMSDDVPASIEGETPARLARDEFVVPADVVSHLGNGSSQAGHDALYNMMNKVRKSRTGNDEQGKQIDAEQYLPA